MTNVPEAAQAVFGIAALIVLSGIYFLPAIVASKRHHRNKDVIAVVNLFLGWTFLGWVIALAWASTDHVAPPRERTHEIDVGATLVRTRRP
jgi:hypothetical protein